MRAESADAVSRFVVAINRHDLDELSSLLAPDHRFVDSLGNAIVGRKNVALAWRRYFEMVPDYLITVARLLGDDAEVALFGTASGSISAPGGQVGNWSIPFAARARVESGRIAEWHVFADNEPVRAILR